MLHFRIFARNHLQTPEPTLQRTLKLSRRALLIAASLAVAFPTTLAQAGERTAKDVITTMVTDALGVMRAAVKEDAKKPNKKATPAELAERKRKLRSIADRAFDWRAMAMGSLGFHWRELDEAKRADFVNVFKEVIANQYMSDIERFQGNEDVKVLDAKAEEELFVVKTTLVTASNEKVPMNYTLHKTPSGWMIEDLSIEGVSMVNHYRQSFNRFLVNKPFAQLLETLRAQLR